MTDEEKPGGDLPPDNNRGEIIEEALGFLFEGLREANRLLKEEKDAGRHGVIKGFNVVTEFLSFFEGTHNHRQPFTHLLDALLSLDEGLVLPLLKQARRTKGGRSLASAARASCQGLVAATVNWLVDTGLNKNNAYERVAKVCHNAGIKPSRKGAKDSPGQELQVTGRTVRYWCEKNAEDFSRHLQPAQTSDRLSRSQTPEAQAIRQAIKSEDKESVRRRLLAGLHRSLVELRAPEH
jgi:hypothetical protein